MNSAMTTTTRSPAQWLELADRNLAEFARLGALWDRRGEIEVRDDLQLVASATRFPGGMFNCALPLAASPDDTRAMAWLRHAAAWFTARERGFTVYVRGERDEALARTCIDNGLVLGGSPPGMLLPAALPQVALPAGTRVERVGDARGLADFAAVAGAGFGLHGMPETITRKILADAERVLTPELSAYVAYVGERPASTAICTLSHGIAGLYWIATHPELHRGGLGTAVTRHASNAAFAAGAAAVILQASAHGEPVYRRLGFQVITTYRWFYATAEVAAKLAS